MRDDLATASALERRQVGVVFSRAMIDHGRIGINAYQKGIKFVSLETRYPLDAGSSHISNLFLKVACAERITELKWGLCKRQAA